MKTGVTGSIRRKVMVIILTTTFVALLVSVIVLLSYEARAYRNFLINDLTTQAEIIAVNSAPALAFDDPESARANLALLGNRTGITAAAIYAADGRLFASFRKPGSNVQFPTDVGLRDPRVEGRAMTLLHPISHNNEQLGLVYLQANYQLAGRIADYLLILGAVMAISFLVAAALSLWLQRSVTAPILAVTDVAQKIVKERNFRLRAASSTDDEIGTLVDAFNTMLGEVDERQQELEQSNLMLKKESEERRNAETALLRADRHKDEFLATLAHELRNPLAPMLNSLAMLEVPGAPPETLKQARAIIDRQLSHMVRLIEDLLDVSRISQGKLTVRKETVALDAVLRSAVDTVRPLLEAKDQLLDLDLPRNPVRLEADPVRLSQVFSNLLNNASKYTPDGGRVSLSVTVEHGEASITIADNGRGIAAETLQSIFGMFVQEKNAEVRTQHGLGVGLALARRLVELHGGTITAASEGRNRGSTFVVRMPVIASRGAQAKQAAPETPPDNALFRILLVDDNVDFATTMSVLLRTLGHDVKVSHDAPEALAAAGTFRPDFAFLDIGLPTMDGYELARRLTENLAHDVRLVAISGWGQPEDRRRAQDAGFGWYLVKPVDLGSIRAILDSVADRPLAPVH